MRLFSIIVLNPLRSVYLGGIFYFPKTDIYCVGAAFSKLFDSCRSLSFYLESPCHAFLCFTHCSVNRAACLRLAETPSEAGRNRRLAGCLDGQSPSPCFLQVSSPRRTLMVQPMLAPGSEAKDLQHSKQQELPVHLSLPLPPSPTGEAWSDSGGCCTHSGFASQKSNPELREPTFL